VIQRGICYSPVTVCVCLSATSRSFTKMAKQIELFFFAWNLPSTHHTLCCKEIRSVQKIRVLPSGTFSQTLDTEKISSRHVDRFVNKTRRRSSLLTTLTTVDESRLYAHTAVVYYTSVDRNALTPFDLFWICCTTCHGRI